MWGLMGHTLWSSGNAGRICTKEGHKLLKCVQGTLEEGWKQGFQDGRG